MKSGHVNVNQVRDLQGVLEREKAATGGLITLREPTRPMLAEAAITGFYESKDFPGRYPRLQILTIAELLAGKKLEYPSHRVETFAKAERKTKHEQEEMFQRQRRNRCADRNLSRHRRKVGICRTKPGAA